MTTLNDKNKEGGASFSFPPAVTDKRKMEIKPTEMVRARCFAVGVFCCFGRWYRGKPTAFSPHVAEQSHIVPPCWSTLFTNPPQHNGPSQTGVWEHIDSYICCSHRTAGWHRLFSFACGPQRSLLEKLDFSSSQRRALGTESQRRLLTITKMVKTKLAAHSKESMKAGNRKKHSLPT